MNPVSEEHSVRPEGSDRIRRGVVFGAGGILGGCWSIGALRALQDRTGFDPRTADALVGTSVGSLLALLLSAGVSPEDLVADQYGQPTRGPLAESGFDHDTALQAGFALRQLPVGSPQLLARALLRPLHYSPMTFLAALCPTGRSSLAQVRKLIEHVLPARQWPSPAHVVATDYDTGRRVLFSARQYPELAAADAVAASCSIPGWFPPVSIGGRRFVDGSVSSVTNADLLADFALDEVYVLAPMAARSFERTISPAGWLQRCTRTVFNRALAGEVRSLRDSATAVHILAPGPEELAAMGANLMDTTRRLDVLDTARYTL